MNPTTQTLLKFSLLAGLAAGIGAAAATEPQLAAVMVTTTRQESRVSDLLSDVTVIDRSAIEQTGGASIIDLLAQQPGIQMMQNGGPGTAAEVFVRGSRTDQVKILLDGVPLNSIDTKGSPLRFIPLAEIERIEIVRGPASALYGADAVGGVIQLFTRRGASGLRGDGYIGLGSFGAQKTAAGISGGDERWRFRLAADDTRADGISAVRNARRRDADHDPYRAMGGNGSLSFAPAPGHELAAQWMHTHGQTFFDGTTGAGTFNSRVDFVNESWSVSSRDALTERWTSTLRYGGSLDDQASYTSATPSLIVTRNTQASWQNDLRLPLGSGLVLFERLDQHVGPAARFPAGKVNISNDAAVLGWNAGIDAHQWQLSGRRDSHSRFGDRNTWAAGYGYQLAPSWRVNVNAGTSFKAPTPYQLYATIAGALVANPSLRPEQGRNRELAVVWGNEDGMASLTWYRNDITDLIDYQSVPRQYQNIGKAKLAGWTAAWNGSVLGWNAHGALDLLDARNELTHKRLERRAAEKLTLGASRDWGQLTTGLEVVSVGHRYSAAGETLPMGGYTLLNMTLRYPLSRQLALELRGNNLTDKQYTTARTGSAGAFDYNTPGINWFAGLRYQMQ